MDRSSKFHQQHESNTDSNDLEWEDPTKAENVDEETWIKTINTSGTGSFGENMPFRFGRGRGIALPKVPNEHEERSSTGKIVYHAVMPLVSLTPAKKLSNSNQTTTAGSSASLSFPERLVGRSDTPPNRSFKENNVSKRMFERHVHQTYCEYVDPTENETQVVRRSEQVTGRRLEAHPQCRPAGSPDLFVSSTRSVASEFKAKVLQRVNGGEPSVEIMDGLQEQLAKTLSEIETFLSKLEQRYSLTSEPKND